jgi:hypothetical protein
MSASVGPKALKGDFAGYNYTWVTLPPIREIKQGDDLTLAMKTMKDSFAAFDTGELPETTSTGVEDKDAKKWNARMDGTRTLFGMITTGSDLNLGYYCFGVMVGIICIIEADPYYVADLVTHPGVANAGEILIEEACNRSATAGHGGKLELYSLNKLSTGFYLSVGFAKTNGDLTSGGGMTLNPAGNALWANLNGRWVLKRYEGQSYYKGVKTPPPIPPKPPRH